MDLERIVPVLPSLNFDSTVRFYEAVLGRAEVFRTADYLIMTFPKSNREIHFYSTKNPKDGESASLYLRVRGIENYHTRANSVRGRMLKQLREEPWGQREFCVLDPSGCLLRFGEPLVAQRGIELN